MVSLLATSGEGQREATACGFQEQPRHPHHLQRTVGASGWSWGSRRLCWAPEAAATHRPCSGAPDSQLLGVYPRSGCSGPWPVLPVSLQHATNRPTWGCLPSWPAGSPGVWGDEGPQEDSHQPLENWLTVCYLLPRLDAGASGTVSHPNFECPPSQVGEGVGQEGVRRSDMHCNDVLKICQHHLKHCKLVKRTWFLRWKISLEVKQIKFKRNPRHIWQKAGLKETPHRLADLQDLPKG